MLELLEAYSMIIVILDLLSDMHIRFIFKLFD